MWEGKNCWHSLVWVYPVCHRKTQTIYQVPSEGMVPPSQHRFKLVLLISVTFFLVTAICEWPSSGSNSKLFLGVKRLNFFLFNSKNHESLDSETLCTERMHVCVRAQWLGGVPLFAAPWIVACQAPQSMGFPRQEYWIDLPFPFPGDRPNPRIKLVSLASPSLTGRFFTTEPQTLSKWSMDASLLLTSFLCDG